MRITDRNPEGRRLQTIFFPAEPRPVMPSDVSDEIVLTHPAAPPMVGFKAGQFFFSETAGAAGAVEVVGPVVPTDRYWWVQFAAVSHNDSSARFVRLSVRDTVPNTAAIFASPATLVSSVPLAIERPFILPNDMRLVSTVIAIGGTFVNTLRFFFFELLHAEVNPTA